MLHIKHYAYIYVYIYIHFMFIFFIPWMKCPPNGFVICIMVLDFDIASSLNSASASTLIMNIWWSFSKYYDRSINIINVVLNHGRNCAQQGTNAVHIQNVGQLNSSQYLSLTLSYMNFTKTVARENSEQKRILTRKPRAPKKIVQT